MAVIEREARIVNPLGMHARPAAEFVKIASRFKSAIHVSKDDLSVNGKSIMGVMMLAAECGLVHEHPRRRRGRRAGDGGAAGAGRGGVQRDASDRLGRDLEDAEDDEPGTARA